MDILDNQQDKYLQNPSKHYKRYKLEYTLHNAFLPHENKRVLQPIPEMWNRIKGDYTGEGLSVIVGKSMYKSCFQRGFPYMIGRTITDNKYLTNFALKHLRARVATKTNYGKLPLTIFIASKDIIEKPLKLEDIHQRIQNTKDIPPEEKLVISCLVRQMNFDSKANAR